MSRHFRVVIDVAYDEATIPENADMKAELAANVRRAADRGRLLSDAADEAIVDEWNYSVEETTVP